MEPFLFLSSLFINFQIYATSQIDTYKKEEDMSRKVKIVQSLCPLKS